MTAPNSQGTAGPEPTRCPTPPDDACIVVVRDGSLVVAVVAGELDLVSEPTVRAELRSAWNGSSGVDALAVYVRDVTFCDARGLGSLLALAPDAPQRLEELLFGNPLGVTGGDLVAVRVADSDHVTLSELALDRPDADR